MANSITQTVNTVFGDKRVLMGTYTATDGPCDTTALVTTGLNRIDLALSCGPASADWTYSGGDLGAKSAVSGYVYQILVVGN